MKNIFIIFILVLFFGFGTYFVLDWYDNNFGQQTIKYTNQDLMKETINENSLELDGENTILYLSGSDNTTGEIIDVVSNFLSGQNVVDFDLNIEKFDEVGLVIKGDLSKSNSGLVDKITVESCKGNYYSGYNVPYKLQKYKYPNFEYRIKGERNNVCSIPYKINFYSKDDKKIYTQEVVLTEKELNEIPIPSKKYTNNNLGIEFQYLNVLDVNIKNDMYDFEIKNFKIDSDNKKWQYNIYGNLKSQDNCNNNGQKKFTKTTYGVEINGYLIDDNLHNYVLCIKKTSNLFIEINVNDNTPDKETIKMLEETIIVYPSPYKPNAEDISLDSIGVGTKNSFSKKENKILVDIKYKNISDKHFLISNQFPIETKCYLESDVLGLIAQKTQNLNRDFENKIIEPQKSIVQKLNIDIDQNIGIGENLFITCTGNLGSGVIIEKNISIEILE